MKKIAMILCSLIVTCIGYAQEKEPAAYAQFAKGYTTDFNKPDYQALALRNAASFRKSISDKKYIDFISGVRSSLGRINKITFKRFDNRGYAVYVAEMEKAWMNFYFILNDSSQVASLIVLDVNYNEVLPIVRN